MCDGPTKRVKVHFRAVAAGAVHMAQAGVAKEGSTPVQSCFVTLHDTAFRKIADDALFVLPNLVSDNNNANQSTEKHINLPVKHHERQNGAGAHGD